MAFTISPWVRQQFFDNDGVPLASGKVYAYAAGTSTPLDTYDAASGSANTNPIILDSSGICDMWLGPYSYKFEIKDSADVLLQTIDGVSAIPLTNVDLLITGTAGENLTMGNSVYLSDGTVGTAGRWYKTDSDVAASSTLAKYTGFVPANITSGETGSIQIQGKVTGLSALSPGSVYYAAATAGDITSSAPANAKPIGVADSTTSLIIPAGTAEATETVPGVVSTSAQVFGGAKTFAVAPKFAPGTVTVAAQDVTTSGRFYKNTTATASSTGGAVDMMTVTVKGNLLSEDGKGLVLTSQYLTAANVNNKQLVVSYGGTTIYDTGVFTGPGAAESIRFEVEIVRTGASVQVCFILFEEGPIVAATVTLASGAALPAKDNTADQILKITASTAVANSDITHRYSFAQTIG